MLVSWKYKPRDTFVQRLDPRTRLLFMLCIILAVTGSNMWDLRFVLPLWFISFLLYFLARLEWKEVRRPWTVIIIFLILIIGLNALLSGRGGPTEVLQNESPTLFSIPLYIPFTSIGFTVNISVVRAWFAITQLFRMTTMVALAIPIPYTIDPSVYGITFRQMGLPDKASFTMDLAFRFVPTLGRDFATTIDAQRARGYELERASGGLFTRIRRLAPLLVPVTMQAIVSGEEVVDALELRAFGAAKRTWLRQLHYKAWDYVLLALGFIIAVSYFILRFMGYGEFWVPQWFMNLAGG